jgi:hypothetical protein
MGAAAEASCLAALPIFPLFLLNKPLQPTTETAIRHVRNIDVNLFFI